MGVSGNSNSAAKQLALTQSRNNAQYGAPQQSPQAPQAPATTRPLQQRPAQPMRPSQRQPLQRPQLGSFLMTGSASDPFGDAQQGQLQQQNDLGDFRNYARLAAVHNMNVGDYIGSLAKPQFQQGSPLFGSQDSWRAPELNEADAQRKLALYRAQNLI